MSGLLNGVSGFLGSPGGSMVMSGLGAGVQTMQGNKAATQSQEMAKLKMQQDGNWRGANMMGALGTHGMDMGGMGASSIANSAVANGATLTSKQARGLTPQVKQNLAGQGGIAPGFMENFMKQLTPQMISSLFQLFNKPGEEEEETTAATPTQGY